MGMDTTKATDVLQRHTSIFDQDGNLGLAQQVVGTVPWIRRVLAESRVYSVITVAELAALVHTTPDDVVRLVTHLATTYSWSVQITPDGWIYFPSSMPSVQSTSSDGLAQTTAELIALQQTVQKMDVTLSASAKYRTLTANTSSSGGGGGIDSSTSSTKNKGPTGPRGVEDV
jgi:hypothetical protein